MVSGEWQVEERNNDVVPYKKTICWSPAIDVLRSHLRFDD